MTANAYADFLQQQQLTEQYLSTAERHFSPLINAIIAKKQQLDCVIVTINGCQGSGKSTLAAYLETRLSLERDYRIAVISLDDFYLTHQARQILAKQIHPLLATRGVPGTHDIPLAITTLNALKQSRGTIVLPRFNKAIDDAYPREQWPTITAPIDIVIFEGWCIGASPQTTSQLSSPINSLERQEDSDGSWRQYVNQQLQTNYAKLFAFSDLSVMLKAPSFDTVYQWRLEQEQKLADKLQLNLDRSPSRLMSTEKIARFIQFFQRLTEHMLITMPDQVDICYQLDQERRIVDE